MLGQTSWKTHWKLSSPAEPPQINTCGITFEFLYYFHNWLPEIKICQRNDLHLLCYDKSLNFVEVTFNFIVENSLKKTHIGFSSSIFRCNLYCSFCSFHLFTDVYSWREVAWGRICFCLSGKKENCYISLQKLFEGHHSLLSLAINMTLDLCRGSAFIVVFVIIHKPFK